MNAFGVRVPYNWFNIGLPSFSGGDILSHIFHYLTGIPALTTLSIAERKERIKQLGYDVEIIERGGKKFTLTKINLFKGYKKHINRIINIVAPWAVSGFDSVQQMDAYLEEEWVKMIHEISKVTHQEDNSYEGALEFTQKVLASILGETPGQAYRTLRDKTIEKFSGLNISDSKNAKGKIHPKKLVGHAFGNFPLFILCAVCLSIYLAVGECEITLAGYPINNFEVLYLTKVISADPFTEKLTHEQVNKLKFDKDMAKKLKSVGEDWFEENTKQT